MTSREQYIEGMKKMPKKLGRKFLLASLAGENISPQQAIWAHCYDCQGGYTDGAEDCKSDICPLRPYMPYNENRRRIEGRGNPEALAKARAAKEEQDDDDMGGIEEATA